MALVLAARRVDRYGGAATDCLVGICCSRQMTLRIDKHLCIECVRVIVWAGWDWEYSSKCRNELFVIPGSADPTERSASHLHKAKVQVKLYTYM